MSTPFGAWSGEIVKEWTFPPRHFLVDQWFYESDVMMLIGKEGIGKSTLDFQFLSALVTTQPFLGEFAVSHPTTNIYVQLEGDKQETHRRLKAVESAVGFTWSNFRFVFQAFQDLQTPAGQQHFRACLDPVIVPGAVVHLDPFYALFPGSGSDDGVIKPVLGFLRTYKEEHNLSLVINHHIRKATFNPKAGQWLEEGAEDALGSRLILAFVDSFFLLTATEHGLRKITSSKGRKGGYIDSITCGQQEVLVSPDEPPVNLFRFDNPLPAGCHLLFSWLLKQSNPTSYEQMVEIAGVKLLTMQRWLKHSTVQSLIVRVNPGHKPAYFVHRHSPAGVKFSTDSSSQNAS